MTDETSNSEEYEQMLLLEDLESLAEEMDEVGVADVAEVKRWLAVSHQGGQEGIPGAADEAALRAILDLMEELEVSSRTELDGRIRALQEQMDWN